MHKTYFLLDSSPVRLLNPGLLTLAGTNASTLGYLQSLWDIKGNTVTTTPNKVNGLRRITEYWSLYGPQNQTGNLINFEYPNYVQVERK